MSFRFHEEATKALKELPSTALDLSEDHYWDCLGPIILHAVHTIQGNGASGAQQTFERLFEGKIPLSTSMPRKTITLSEFVGTAKKDAKWGQVWAALFESQAPYETTCLDSRVFGIGARYEREFDDFCEHYSLKKQWLGRNSKGRRIRKIEGACQVMSGLLQLGTETREDVVSGNFERKLRVFGLARNFFEQLRRHCGDRQAIKVDKRIQEFANRHLPRGLKDNDAATRYLVEEMAALKGIDPVHMDYAIYSFNGGNP